jgi:hypothetical protein
MKTFEAVFNENNRGVYGISLVESPAMESDFIALSKDEKKTKVEFKSVDEKKFILAGLVLEPNKPVYRNQDGEEFNIVFSDQTVEDLCYNFSKQDYNSNSTVEHDDAQTVKGVAFVENWLVRDEKIDTAVALGLNCKKGSWVTVMKCDNREIYDKALAGEIKGFSIDAFVTLKEVNLKSNIEMAEEKKSFADQVNEVLVNLGLVKVKETEIKLGSIKSEDGAVTIMFDGESMEIGGSVWVEGEDMAKIPLPIGEIPLEGGAMLVIAEEGIIAEVKEAQAEEPAPEQELAEPVTPTATAKEVTDAIKSVLIKYSEDLDVKFEEINAKLSEVVKENETLKSEVVTLSEQPASKAIKATPEQSIKLNAKGRLLAKMRNNK